MKKKIDPLHITFKNSKKRAVGAIFLAAFTILTLSISILFNLFGYNEKNMPFYFYPGLVFVLIMTFRWIPSIMISLRSPDFLVKSENGGIIVFGQNDNFSGHRFFKYSEIREVNIEKTFLKNDVVIELIDNSILKIPVIFAQSQNFKLR